jgi:hypothetical protein
MGLAALALAGCVGEVVDEGAAPAYRSTASDNGLSLNKLSLNKLSLNELSLGRLPGGGTASFAGLEATPDGREVLTYLARCALAEDQALVATHDGVVHEFPGRLGLAPEWTRGACDRTCQRWVSACLLAHGNGLGVSVPISLRGSHPALATSPDEREAYPVQEGAFYGNVFDPVWGVEYPAYICTGQGLDHLGDPASDLRKRLCGVWNECPIDCAGSCGHDPARQTSQCLPSATDHYERCIGGAPQPVRELPDGADASDPPGEADMTFDEVITVYLRR